MRTTARTPVERSRQRPSHATKRVADYPFAASRRRVKSLISTPGSSWRIDLFGWLRRSGRTGTLAWTRASAGRNARWLTPILNLTSLPGGTPLGWLINVALMLVVLVVLIVAHEFGHFVLARRAGVTVHEFGIGSPPRIATIGRLWGTPITLNAIPLGGFVKLEGENSAAAHELDGNDGTANAAERPRSTRTASRSSRCRPGWRSCSPGSG